LFASHASGGEYGPAGVYTVIHSSSTPTLFVWQLGNSAWGAVLADHTISYETNSKILADVGSGNPYYVCDGSTWADTTASSANQQTLSFWQSGTHLVFELTNPYYEAPTSVPSFNAENGGGWNGGVSTFYRYTGFTGEPTDGYVYTFAYNGVSPGNTSETIKYSFANGWEDYPLNSTTTNPFSVNTSDGSTAIGGTIYPANTIVGLDTAGNFLFKFGHKATYPDPYYEAPALNWWEDGYGALPVITGTGALNGQSFSFYAEDSSHIEFVLSSTASASNPSTIKFTKSDGTWVDGTSGDWPSQVNYDSTNVILRTNTWSNEFVNPNTSSPYTA